MELAVPGASLRYDVAGDGPVLLLIPPGPSGGSAFHQVVPLLLDAYTVVTYDPRGLSRSSILDRDADISPATQADDAARVLAAVSRDPAFVFGSSSGATTGLELVTRYPERVRLLVPHEPPVVELLADREAQLAGFDDISDTYQRQGAGAALGKFMLLTGAAASAEPIPIPPEGLPNIELFLAHMMRAIVTYRPDIVALREASIAVGVGATSAGEIANRCARALSERLGVAPTVFPGGHPGFATDTEAFVATLRGLLPTA
jgi:pimeloyl-ACP methyl ester carboxylesterase